MFAAKKSQIQALSPTLWKLLSFPDERKGVSPFQLIESLLQKLSFENTHGGWWKLSPPDSVSALNLGGVRRAHSIIQSPDLSPIMKFDIRTWNDSCCDFLFKHQPIQICPAKKKPQAHSSCAQVLIPQPCCCRILIRRSRACKGFSGKIRPREFLGP